MSFNCCSQTKEQSWLIVDDQNSWLVFHALLISIVMFGQTLRRSPGFINQSGVIIYEHDLNGGQGDQVTRIKHTAVNSLAVDKRPGCGSVIVEHIFAILEADLSVKP